MISPPKIGDGSKRRARILREGMELEVVDDPSYAVDDDLYRSIGYKAYVVDTSS